MCSKHYKSLILSSSFSQLERLEPFVKVLQDWLGFDRDDFNRIQLPLNEAATNAIRHGNQEDPHKQVTITAEWVSAKRKLSIGVEDEGAGFDPNGVPNPLHKENIMKKGGRGIFLISQYADEYHYSNNGSKITIIYYLNTQEPDSHQATA